MELALVAIPLALSVSIAAFSELVLALLRACRLWRETAGQVLKLLPSKMKVRATRQDYHLSSRGAAAFAGAFLISIKKR
jgi:hypothetical protein